MVFFGQAKLAVAWNCAGGELDPRVEGELRAVLYGMDDVSESPVPDSPSSELSVTF